MSAKKQKKVQSDEENEPEENQSGEEQQEEVEEKKPTKKRKAEEKEKPSKEDVMSEKEFMSKAKALKITLNGVEYEAAPQTFKTGSYGWGLSGKVLKVDVGGKEVQVQVSLNLPVRGSKKKA